MLQVSNLSKSYGDNIILENVSFIVNVGERLGLVGPNGCGKTTLLRIVVGAERPDGGSVRFQPPGLRLGYLEQGLVHDEKDTLAHVLLPEEARLAQLEAELAQLGAALATANGEKRSELANAYDRALAELERVAVSQAGAHEARTVLAGLGLGNLPLDTRVSVLSGGQKTRLGLARLLLERAQLLLLDEPTNHLDIEALEWLEGWLQQYPGAALVVSHDRTFLDRTVNTILELDPETHTVTAYPGNYSDYVETKTREREKHWAAYKDQQERTAHVLEEVRRLSHYATNIERGTIDFATRKIAMGIARQAVVQRRRLERELERDQVKKPSQTWQMKLEFSDTPSSGRDVLILEGLAAGYGGVPLFSGVSEALRAGERVALVGPNGVGKTTLLRVIGGELEPLAGRARLGAGVKLGYLSQEQTDLDPDSNPLDTVRQVATMGETEARTFLHCFLFSGDDVFVPVRDLSFGERARLALARLVGQGCNFLLLDEPINHLDIPSRSQFEQAMVAFEGTVLAVVHDRYFIRQFATGIWALRGGRLKSYFGLEDLGSEGRREGK